MINIIDAILAVDPKAQAHVEDENWEKISWINGYKGLSIDEIKLKYNELKSIYDSQSYARSRLEEYPDFLECIHALLDGGDTLTELQAKRAEIKAKYPKPT